MQQVYKATDVGLVRRGNEDNLAVFDTVYVVADGMGGEAAGEVASQMLVDMVRQELSGREHIDAGVMQSAIMKANQAIRQYVWEHPNCEGMGTTATILHITPEGSHAFWAHVGDSRLYLLRAGQEQLEQLTQDHSYVEDLVREGTITREEAKHHPQRNMLTRAVGVMENLVVDTGELTVEQGDMFLLATDGLMKHMTDTEIAHLLRQGEVDPAQSLVQTALNAGGRDNVTVVVVSLT